MVPKCQNYMTWSKRGGANRRSYRFSALTWRHAEIKTCKYTVVLLLTTIVTLLTHLVFYSEKGSEFCAYFAQEFPNRPNLSVAIARSHYPQWESPSSACKIIRLLSKNGSLPWSALTDGLFRWFVCPVNIHWLSQAAFSPSLAIGIISGLTAHLCWFLTRVMHIISWHTIP